MSSFSPSRPPTLDSASSPPFSSCPSVFNLLEEAAELMMVHRDFQAALDVCNRGLYIVCGGDPEDHRCAEFRAGFCILGIQALAEMNKWRGVLSWLLQQYENPEKIPAKILQMCILLYSKVGEPGEVQESVRAWLTSLENMEACGFRTVAELYLLYVLLPLGHTQEARELMGGPVGRSTFTEEQRMTALEAVDEKEREIREEAESQSSAEVTTQPVSTQGSVVHKLESVLRCLYRNVTTVGSAAFPLRRLFLTAVLLYMLLLRMDPALPSSFMWISKLLQLLRQMWASMFAPYYYQAPSKGL